ncbi:hypothetical protein [Falsihalocynthiibacter arcticus]|uniref:Uncharacterized protein n=1 Tax=Falsihalocynthiibacter arcticus TaxID=1579316 RepID=A0A126UXN4_9RHOB|nr:hypothetical protein [Falsihalocynthiibacter arcticus]AML50821.1 hypothetical protein RC74_05555 [Falsihalocynthiibacter arcticus]
MIRNLRTLLLVAVLAVPSFSAPAQANEDLKKFLAAIAVMGIIGVVAERERDNKPVAVPVKPIPDQIYKPNRRWTDNNKRLPQNCYRSFQTTDGNRSYYVEDCLNKHFRHAQNLPKQCEIKLKNNGKGKWKGKGHGKGKGKGHDKHVKVYSPNCLQHNGYFTQRREY